MTNKQIRKIRHREKVNFHLPQLSLDKIQRIIIGYSQQPHSVSFHDLAKEINEIADNVTLTHGFLLDMDIIEGPYDKNITPKGRSLGRALSLGVEDEIRDEWRKIIDSNQYCLTIMKQIKQLGDLSRLDFQKRMFYAAGYAGVRKDYAVGANSLIRIFQIAGYVARHGTKYYVCLEADELEKKQNSQGDNSNIFINPNYITELEIIKRKDFDLKRLVKYCKEINYNFQHQNYFSVFFLCRAVLDHCPPIFGFPNFASLSQQLSNRNSLKSVADNLDATLRNIASYHIHKQIGTKEILLAKEEIVDFRGNVNFLIRAIIDRLLTDKDS